MECKKINEKVFSELSSGFVFFSNEKGRSVNGYYKSNGTYVQPHYRSSPNSTTSDNWSTLGNTNPRTGKSGTRKSCGSLSLSC